MFMFIISLHTSDINYGRINRLIFDLDLEVQRLRLINDVLKMIYGCYSLLVFSITVCMSILLYCYTVHEKQNHKSLKYKKTK